MRGFRRSSTGLNMTTPQSEKRKNEVERRYRRTDCFSVLDIRIPGQGYSQLFQKILRITLKQPGAYMISSYVWIKAKEIQKY